MNHILNPSALEQVFLGARTANAFLPREVSDATLEQLYDLAKWGPTSMNTQPMRILFVRGDDAKAKLKGALAPGNVDKSMAAPVVAVIAFAPAFYENLPTQFPAVPVAKDMFAGNAALAQDTAFRNSSMQGAYLILAARMVGLAAGPMSGFDPVKVNEAFFSETKWQVNFLINLGYGDPAGYRPRGPRLAFEDAALIV